MWVIWLCTKNVTTGRIPLFYERDDSFLSYVQSLINTPDSKKASLAAEIDQVSYMFSHLVLAQRKLAKGYSSVQNIECLNGFRLLVKEPADGLLLFAGVSNDLAGASLYEADRRLDTLISIVTFLYGPSYDYYLGCLALSSKRHCWNIISLLLNKWHELLHSEQCYLVEAVEELCLNIRVEGSTSVKDEFDAILNEARRVVKHKMGCTYDHVIHTMLVVESKVLKFSSSEKDRALSTYDMLLMLLASLAYFPSHLAPEDLCSKVYRKEQSADTANEDSEDDFPIEIRSDSESQNTDRYFVDAIDEETGEEEELFISDPSDTQSLLSAQSNSTTQSNGTTQSITSTSYTSTGSANTSADKGVHFALGGKDLQLHMNYEGNDDVNVETSDTQQTAESSSCREKLCNTSDFREIITNKTDVSDANTSKDDVESDDNSLTVCSSSDDCNIQTPSVSAKDLESLVDKISENEPQFLTKEEADGSNGALPNDSPNECTQLSEVPECGTAVDESTSVDESPSVDESTSASVPETPPININRKFTIELEPADESTPPSSLDTVVARTCSEDNVQSLMVNQLTSATVSDSNETVPIEIPTTKAAANEVTPMPSLDAVNFNSMLENQELTMPDMSVRHRNSVPSIVSSSTTEPISIKQSLRKIKNHSFSPNSPNVSPSSDLGGRLRHNSAGSVMGSPASTRSLNLSVGKSKSLKREKEAFHSESVKRPIRASSFNESGYRIRQQNMSDRGRRSFADTNLADGDAQSSLITQPRQSLERLPRRASMESEASYHTAALPERYADSSLNTTHLLEKVKEKADNPHFSEGTFVHKRVFLRSPVCKFVPACLYITAVSPGINIIVAAEITDPQKPHKIVDALSMLSTLLKPKQPSETRSLDRFIDKISDKLKDVAELVNSRFKDVRHKEKCEKMFGLWKKCQAEVKSYYMSKLTNEDGDMAERLDEMEDSVLLVAGVLKELFTHLYMRLSPLAEDALSRMKKLQKKARSRLISYKGILLVRANLNMPISAFQNEKYPGLVHFIYICRSKNFLKSPSIYQLSEDDSLKAQVIRDMKSRLWRVLPWMYKQVENGYTLISVKDGDFTFTFELCIYDEVNYKFLPKLLNKAALDSSNGSAIGDLRGQFYKQILKRIDLGAGCKCVEFLTVHFAVISEEMISKQRIQLFENELHKRSDILRN